MPGRYSGRNTNRRFAMRPIDSMKNVVSTLENLTTATLATTIAKAVDNPANTSQEEVSRGCTIKAIWISLDVCGLAASGALQRTGIYLIKNPGANLTPPGVLTVGTSNEKKFVLKQWYIMTMRNQDGNPPYHWEGWIKIPKRYQRMGAGDLFSLVWATDTLTGHGTAQFIYKWYR